MWKNSEIWGSYMRAGKSSEQVKILSELNAVPVERIQEILDLCEARLKEDLDLDTGLSRGGGYAEMAKKRVFTDDILKEIRLMISKKVARGSIAKAVGLEDNPSFQQVYYRLRKEMESTNETSEQDGSGIKTVVNADVGTESNSDADRFEDAGDFAIKGATAAAESMRILSSDIGQTYEQKKKKKHKNEQKGVGVSNASIDSRTNEAEKSVNTASKSSIAGEVASGTVSSAKESISTNGSASEARVSEDVKPASSVASSVNVRDTVLKGVAGQFLAVDACLVNVQGLKCRIEELKDNRQKLLEMADMYSRDIVLLEAQLRVVESMGVFYNE